MAVGASPCALGKPAPGCWTSLMRRFLASDPLRVGGPGRGPGGPGCRGCRRLVRSGRHQELMSGGYGMSRRRVVLGVCAIGAGMLALSGCKGFNPASQSFTDDTAVQQTVSAVRIA